MVPLRSGLITLGLWLQLGGLTAHTAPSPPVCLFRVIQVWGGSQFPPGHLIELARDWAGLALSSSDVSFHKPRASSTEPISGSLNLAPPRLSMAGWGWVRAPQRPVPGPRGGLLRRTTLGPEESSKENTLPGRRLPEVRCTCTCAEAWIHACVSSYGTYGHQLHIHMCSCIYM